MKTVAHYFKSQSPTSRKNLKEIQKLLKKLAPGGEDVISYGMPAYKFHGKLLMWYAARKNHFAIYPYAKSIVVFKEQLKTYKTSRGTIQFTLDKPLPKKLVGDIIKFRVKEILALAKKK